MIAMNMTGRKKRSVKRSHNTMRTDDRFYLTAFWRRLIEFGEESAKRRVQGGGESREDVQARITLAAF
jgi:hypothetical protein